MAIVVETFIICDGHGCGNNFGVDDRQRTGAQQRREMKFNGWKHINGKDYCPSCVAEREKTKSSKLKP